MPQLYLASKSPRRREILAQIGVAHHLIDIDVPELRAEGESPEKYVERLAQSKAQAGVQALRSKGLAPAPVLGADTICVLDQQTLEKPRDEDHAIGMLLSMAGREHRVLTAICLNDGRREEVACSETRVRFSHFTEAQARTYWQTGEPVDKAGAYGIQGCGAALVEHISGSYSGVVGLPIETLVPLLKLMNVAIWQKRIKNP